jgi:hypothetical protein
MFAGAVTTALASEATVVLQDSIKAVEAAPHGGALDPRKPFITRTNLQGDESSAAMVFEVVLKMRNFGELKSRVSKGERISPSEMAAKYQPLATDYQSVVNWLTAHGFTIIRQDQSRVIWPYLRAARFGRFRKQ